MKPFSVLVISDWIPTWMSQEVSKWLGSVGYNPKESLIYK